MTSLARAFVHISLMGCFLIGPYVSSRAIDSANSNHAPDIPQTPAGKLLGDFIDAVNSQDVKQIDLFVRSSVANNEIRKDSPALASRAGSVSAPEVALTLLNLARRSGGLILVSVSPEGSWVNAEARTKTNGKAVYLTLHVNSEPRVRIDDYQIIPAPPSLDKFIPEFPPSASLAVRLGVARQALENASKHKQFSGTLLVARHGTKVFTAAYGFANNEANIPNKLGTRFGIASVGKLFTAVAVAQLVAHGKLSYDTPIIRYLPDYPNKPVASEVTLRQLLTHTSGLADFLAKEAPKSHLHSLKDYYPLFAHDPLLFEPGKDTAYSNTGFLVASMIVEQVSGEEFKHYLRKHIFDPAGMAQTGWAATPDAALPYTLGNADDPLAPDRPWVSAAAFYRNLPSGPAAGPGGEYSTVGDLLRFVTALQSGKLLAANDLNTLISEGYGCQCSAQPFHRIYAHAGGGPGVDAGLKLYVDQDFVVMFLSNYDAPFPRLLASWIGDLLLEP
jgi:D-alanyl-D-alanine carboxypeptidase